MRSCYLHNKKMTIYNNHCDYTNVLHNIMQIKITNILINQSVVSKEIG